MHRQMQSNKKKGKDSVPWLLSIKAKMKLKQRTRSDFSAKPSSDFSKSLLSPLAIDLSTKENITQARENAFKMFGYQEDGQFEEKKIKQLLKPEDLVCKNCFIL